MSAKIKKVTAREILDSRGNPTVEAEVWLEDGSFGMAAAPSGASTGAFEAWELRDGDNSRYFGKGVKEAVNNVNRIIKEKLVGMDVLHLPALDAAMFQADGTKEKSKLGANAILAVSMAAAKAGAAHTGLPLYRYIGGVNAVTMPVPMMNILNGGAHADSSVDVQEFMILPIGACCFKEGLRWCSEVYHSLKKLLHDRGLSTAIGDEGGFAPNLSSDEEVLDLLMEAVSLAGYRAAENGDFMISLDIAASEWKHMSKGRGYYHLPKKGADFTSEELIAHWEKIVEKYPVFSLEDPLDEEDWDGWRELTKRIGDKVLLVGDDLFVTNTTRLKKGMELGAGNAVLIKPNQIGSVSETLEAVRLAKEHGFRTIMSHRSGETEDTTIADLAVALNTGFIKTGAPCRGERTAKYNRLLRIEEELKGEM
ncbi:MAG: phosphopyruvate hydratase [Lachnospiraceae bacterium]